MKNINRLKKVCSFCVSDWHFITTIIPYIDEKTKENNSIEVYVENNYTQKINTFLTRINLDMKLKQLIRNLEWNEKRINEYGKIKENLENIKNKEFIIIVKGSNSYIEKINKYIEKWAGKNTEKRITVVNFYDVMQFNENIAEILDKHERILNASGEKNIEDVFEGYNKEEEAQ